MGEIDIDWKGCCSDRAVQEELLKYLRILENQCISSKVRECSEWIDSKIRELGSVDRSDGESFDLEKLKDQKRNLSETGITRSLDQTLEGNLIVDIDVALDHDQLLREVRERDLKLISISNQKYLHLSRLGVHGIEFKFGVFESTYYFPPLGFVFLVCPEIPALHGCMVKLTNESENKRHKFRDADWIIELPDSVSNRSFKYRLLRWVSYFFIPNMYSGFYRGEKLDKDFMMSRSSYFKKRVRELGSRELALKEELRRIMNVSNEEVDFWGYRGLDDRL